MSTVALAMIVKDEVDDVKRIVASAVNYVDEINLVVSHKDAADKLTAYYDNPKIHIKYRAWNNKFDEARNASVDMCTTDYYFWLDCDDEFDFDVIPEIVQLADENGFDQIMLPYIYARDEKGNTIAWHWRERLIRRSHPFTWKGWIHETPVTNVPFKAHRVDAPVVHIAEEGHVHESLDRNHKILLEAVKETDDPRYKMYLGSSFHSRKEYGEALTVLDEFVKISGSAEDIYRALGTMAECAYMMKAPTAAINYSLQQAAVIPEYPQAYYSLAHWEQDQENWREALEWVKVAETKPDPEGMGVYNPEDRERSRLIAAQCEFMLGNHKSALKWLMKVDPKNETRQELEEGFRNEANAEQFIELLPKFRKYFNSDKELYNALCYDLKYDKRLRGLRKIAEPPTKWGDKSIVILCGPGYEEWGPHTLDNGMGGSEEAIVYLSRELAKLGWDVDIYGAVETDLIDDAVPTMGHVFYRPHKQFNQNDEFNVFVAWRAPEFAEHVNAKVKIADIHDVLGKDRMRNYDDVTYFVKSQYHKNLYPHIDDYKFRVIGNGIVKEQFHD